MPTYSFQMSARLAGSSVSVTAVGSSAVVASGTLDTNALFTASLPVGDYVATAADGHYSYRSAGTVAQSDPDQLAELSTFARQPAMTMALLGDSITNNNSVNDYLVTDSADPLYPYNATYNGSLWRYTSGQGFWTWANAYLGQRFTQVRPATGPNNEFGMSGKTALQLVTEGYVDQVIAANPGWCHVLAGTNDIYGSLVSAQITADRVRDVVSPLVRAGIRVVLGTILPRATTTAPQAQTVRDANTKIKAWAATMPNVIVNDWHMALVDSATGYGKSAYFADGTHPFGIGASRMGYHLAKVLEPFTPKMDVQIGLNGLLGTQGLQLGTGGIFGGSNAAGGSGSLAAGSTCYVNTGVTIVASKVARTDLIPGEWQQVQQTSASANSYNYTLRNSNVGVDFNIGDTVYGLIEYETDAVNWNANQLFATLRALPADQRVDAAGNTSDGVLYQPVVSKGVLRTPSLVVPSNTTYLRLDATCGGGTHTIRWGRMQIHKA